MRVIAVLAFLVLAFGATGARAATPRINLKEDASGRVTGYWLITENAHDNTPNWNDLIRKILVVPPRRLPDQLPISMTYYVYAECNHANRRPVAQPRPLTPYVRQDFVLICP